MSERNVQNSGNRVKRNSQDQEKNLSSCAEQDPEDRVWVEWQSVDPAQLRKFRADEVSVDPAQGASETADQTQVQVLSFCEGAGPNPSDFSEVTKKASHPSFSAENRTGQGFSRDTVKKSICHGEAENRTGQGLEGDVSICHDNLPPFPLDVFPTWLRNLVTECEKVFSCPQEVVVSAMLSAIGCALGGSCELFIKDRYKRKAPLFLILVAPSGTGKGPGCSFAFRPIHDCNARLYDEYKEELKSYNALDKEEQKTAERPVFRSLTTDDVTYEKLVDRLQNRRGTFILNSEILGFLSGMGRYKADRSVYSTLLNRVFSYDPIQKDRVGAESVYIRDPTLGIFGETQTDIVRRLFDDVDAASGFLARFNFVFCEQKKPRRLNREDISESLATKWKDFISWLCEQDFDSEGKAKRFNVSTEAYEVFEAWSNRLSDEVYASNNDGERAALVKLECTAISLALMLHFVEGSERQSVAGIVEKDTVDRALRIADWLKEHTENFFFPKEKKYTSFQRDLIAVLKANKESILEKYEKESIVSTSYIADLVNEAHREQGTKISAKSVATNLKQLGIKDKRKNSVRGFEFTKAVFNEWQNKA